MDDPADELTEASVLAARFRTLMSKLRRRLREQTHTGNLTPTQVSVLFRLEKDGPTTQSDLARAEGMRPQSMGAVIAPLEAAGFVSGSPDPADGRQILLSVTKAYRKQVRESRPARQDWLTRTVQTRFSAPERRKIAAAIELLQRLVED